MRANGTRSGSGWLSASLSHANFTFNPKSRPVPALGDGAREIESLRNHHLTGCTGKVEGNMVAEHTFKIPAFDNGVGLILPCRDNVAPPRRQAGRPVSLSPRQCR